MKINNEHTIAGDRPVLQALTVLNISGQNYLLPNGAEKLPAILDALAGLERINEGNFFYIEKNPVCKMGPAEFSVSSWFREVATSAEMAELEKQDHAARKARLEKVPQPA